MERLEARPADHATVVRELTGERATVAELLTCSVAPVAHDTTQPPVLYVIRVAELTPRLAHGIDRVKQATKRTRIVLILDTCTTDTALSCFAAGADEVFVKPFSDIMLGLRMMALTRSLSEMAELETRNAALVRQVRQLEGIAYNDPVTVLPNRRAFEQALRREGARHQRSQESLALVLCDIDHFKLYNDTYGHQHGDMALRRVAIALSRAMRRETDLVCRYGGEEFVALLSNTDLAGAEQVAQAMRGAVAALNVPHRASFTAPHLTVSCGIAALVPASSVEVSNALGLADQALYAAKHAGRDQVSGVGMKASRPDVAANPVVKVI